MILTLCYCKRNVCVANLSVQGMCLHRKIFHLKSGFKKRFSPQTLVLVLNLISITPFLHRQFLYFVIPAALLQICCCQNDVIFGVNISSIKFFLCKKNYILQVCFHTEKKTCYKVLCEPVHHRLLLYLSVKFCTLQQTRWGRPVDNTSSIDYIYNCVKKKYFDTWHLTCDT